MNIGQYLIKARKRQGLSQEDVANTLNVSRQSVSLWECDQTVPTLDNLISLSTLYKVSVDVLTGQKDFDDVNNQAVMQNDNQANQIAEELKEKREKTIKKRAKLFFILSCVFSILSILTLLTPGFSTLTLVPALVFSILSLVNKKTSLRIFILIMVSCLFVAHIFVYINFDLIRSIVMGGED